MPASGKPIRLLTSRTAGVLSVPYVPAAPSLPQIRGADVLPYTTRVAALMRNPPILPRVPRHFALAAARQGLAPTRFLLVVNVARQGLQLFEKTRSHSWATRFQSYAYRKRLLISTSAWGIGQSVDSYRTPLGLHHVAVKAGGGYPLGTVFRSRRPVGLTWKGLPDAAIVHRILWLEGLESGFNRGGGVDTFRRYIYIHGFGDELTLGRPCSHGCIHLAAADLLPLFDLLPVGTLVWIAAR